MEDKKEKFNLFNETDNYEDKKKNNSFGLLTTVIIALIFSIIFSAFFIQIRQVNGSSMVPTLENGNICIVSKCSYWFSQPIYNDIVIIDSRVDRKHKISDDISDILLHNMITSLFTDEQDNQHTYWIKRVVGLPGDEISFSEGKLVRNGEVIDESYTNDPKMLNTPTETTVVPTGYVYVMGDNRNVSEDSRVIGCVPFSNVLGKTLINF